MATSDLDEHLDKYSDEEKKQIQLLVSDLMRIARELNANAHLPDLMNRSEGGRHNEPNDSLNDSFQKLLKWFKPDPTQPFENISFSPSDQSAPNPNLALVGRVLANMKDKLDAYKQYRREREGRENNHENQDLNNPGQSDGSSFTGQITRWYENLESASTTLENLFTKWSKSYTFFPTPQLENEETPEPPISLGLKIENEHTQRCWSCNHLKSSEDWIQVEPTVSTMNETTMYSLESSPGHFECRVSGLRWVCESNVSFRYRFSCWEPHRAFLQNMHLEQGGPLLNVSIISGELKEIHLPHFVCIEPGSSQFSLRNDMKVLHVKDSLVCVEEVYQVTRFHVKLLHPSFSDIGVALRKRFRRRVHCDLRIYRSTKVILTLHTYLIPRNHKLAESLDREEESYGFSRLPKPKPERSCRLGSHLRLKTSCLSRITPDRVKFRPTMPNYFEVYIKDAAIDFEMELLDEKEKEPIWEAEIRAVEYQDGTSIGAEQFVDGYRPELIQRVNNVAAIADYLLARGMICGEGNANISAAQTRQGKMRVVFDALDSGGPQVKVAFFTILKRVEPHLVKDLHNSCHS